MNKTDLVNPSKQSSDRFFFIMIKELIETGHDMLYMFEKILLKGISFYIVYNESAHENMKKKMKN